MLERRPEDGMVFCVNIVLIGHPADEPLPENKRTVWDGGVTELVYRRRQ